MAVLCVRTFNQDEKAMALSGSELSLHHDLDEAVKNHSVPGLLNCKFYELVTVTRSDIFHAACRAERTKRDAAMQKSQEKDTELRFAASTLGIEMEEEE